MSKQVKVSYHEDGIRHEAILTRQDGQKVTFCDGRRGVTRTLWVCEEDGTSYVYFDGNYWELAKNRCSVYGWWSNSVRRRLRFASEVR